MIYFEFLTKKYREIQRFIRGMSIAVLCIKLRIKNNLEVQPYRENQIILHKLRRYNIMESLELHLQGIYDNMRKVLSNRKKGKVTYKISFII